MSNIDLKVQNWNQKKEITFDELVKAVKVTSEASQASALKAINRSLTMRNWLIGYYIVEFEQKGKERAQYGDKLLKRLEERVDSKGLTEQTFRFCRVFYSFYPQMGALFQTSNPTDNQIGATVSRELQLPDNQSVEKYATVSREFISSPVDVISRLSFSHIRELLTIDNPPVGLLLCTQKGKKMVEYAKAGMDNKLFVSTYQLQLPDERTLE